MTDIVNNKLAIIILAAGCSSRLGQAKQLIKNKNVSLLQQTNNLALTLTNNLVCVLGFQADVFAQQILNLDVKIIINENWQKGLGSSIALGVENLDKKSEGVLILLCDQWALTKGDLQNLIDHWQQHPTNIIASCFSSRKDGSTVIGAPVIFPASYFNRLQELTNTGAQSLLRNNEQVIPIEISNAVFDLDTPEDLKEFQSQKKLKLNLEK